MLATKISEKYNITLMTMSVLIIIAMVAGITIYPEQGKNIAKLSFTFMMTHFGSTLQLFIGLGALFFLIWLALSKYGCIQLGKGKVEFSNLDWYSMMFFCGNGSGTIFWVFTEWGYHFNANPRFDGVTVSHALRYERSMAYTIFDWGPNMWAICGLFIIPFAYHYYVKENDQLKLSQVCQYAFGEKRMNGFWGNLIDFLFIFAAVISLSISAGTSGTTMAKAFSDFIGIHHTFGITAIILIAVALLYTISSLVGIEKGMRRISDWNIYISVALLLFILFMGPTQFIIDSTVNSVGMIANDFFRIVLWTDPIEKSGYPQSWTAYYFVFFLIFGPFTGLFVAKISRGRTIKEVIITFVICCSLGAILLFAVVGFYQQYSLIHAIVGAQIVDVPMMVANNQAADIASRTLQSLPYSWIPIILYLFAILFFLATTLDACAFTLASTVSKKLQANQEPSKILKFAWCTILIALPLAITYTGTNINTVKSIVTLAGLPLSILIFFLYYGILKDMKKEFGYLTREEIIDKSRGFSRKK